MAARRYEICLRVLKYFFNTAFRCERHNLLYDHSNGDLFTCEDNMLFSRMKISCFRAKAHLIFYWCLYNKTEYDIYSLSLVLFVNKFVGMRCCFIQGSVGRAGRRGPRGGRGDKV